MKNFGGGLHEKIFQLSDKQGDNRKKPDNN
jgi:hypothetical protein